MRYYTEKLKGGKDFSLPGDDVDTPNLILSSRKSLVLGERLKIELLNVPDNNKNKKYNALLKPVINGFADVVYGSRFTGANPHRILFFWHSIGNKILTFFSNMFTNLNLTDMETCYKLFKTETIQKIKLKEKRFGFEPEVTSKISRFPNIRIYEVGISYYGRTFQEGKKINWKDGFRAFYYIIKYNIFCRKIY
jgi:hypothetical protein